MAAATMTTSKVVFFRWLAECKSMPTYSFSGTEIRLQIPDYFASNPPNCACPKKNYCLLFTIYENLQTTCPKKTQPDICVLLLLRKPLISRLSSRTLPQQKRRKENIRVSLKKKISWKKGKSGTLIKSFFFFNPRRRRRPYAAAAAS